MKVPHVSSEEVMPGVVSASNPGLHCSFHIALVWLVAVPEKWK